MLFFFAENKFAKGWIDSSKMKTGKKKNKKKSFHPNNLSVRTCSENQMWLIFTFVFLVSFLFVSCLPPSFVSLAVSSCRRVYGKDSFHVVYDHEQWTPHPLLHLVRVPLSVEDVVKHPLDGEEAGVMDVP